MKNRLAAAGVVLGLVGGGAIGVAVGIPGISNAQTSPVTTVAPAADAPGVDDSNKDAAHEAAETPEQAAAERPASAAVTVMVDLAEVAMAALPTKIQRMRRPSPPSVRPRKRPRELPRLLHPQLPAPLLPPTAE